MLTSKFHTIPSQINTHSSNVHLANYHMYLERQEGDSRASRSRGRRPPRVALTLTRPADLSFSFSPSPIPLSLHTPFPRFSPTRYNHIPPPGHATSRRRFHGSAIFAGPLDTDIHGPPTFGGIICAIEVIPPCLAGTKLPLRPAVSLTSRDLILFLLLKAKISHVTMTTMMIFEIRFYSPATYVNQSWLSTHETTIVHGYI